MSPANLPGLTLPLDHLVGSGHDRVDGYDISVEATHCAASNAAAQGLSDRCHFHNKSFEFGGEKPSYDLIVCNPPYIPFIMERGCDTGAFCRLDLVHMILDTYQNNLRASGSLWMIVSSVTYIDSAFSRKMKYMMENHFVEVAEEKIVPFNILPILSNAIWIDSLVAAGGIFVYPDEDYEYWHRIQVLRITAK